MHALQDKGQISHKILKKLKHIFLLPKNIVCIYKENQLICLKCTNASANLWRIKYFGASVVWNKSCFYLETCCDYFLCLSLSASTSLGVQECQGTLKQPCHALHNQYMFKMGRVFLSARRACSIKDTVSYMKAIMGVPEMNLFWLNHLAN